MNEDGRINDLATLSNQVLDRDQEIARLKATLNERNLAGAKSDQALADRDAQIIALNKVIAKLDKELKHIVTSKSWKLTKPLRIVRRFLDSGEFDFNDGYTLPDFTDDQALNAAMPNSVASQLKPDPHYGLANLEAARMALAHSDVTGDSLELKDNGVVAVVIHAFYEAIFDEILGYLEKTQSTSLKLYVTTSIELFEAANRKLQLQKHSFYVLPVSNRGRDILPFLKIMPEVVKSGHDLLIKVHTKKSVHRKDGDVWRKDVFDKLLSDQSVKANIDYLANNSDVGILGPIGHIVPMEGYTGANAGRVAQLAALLSIDNTALQQLNFVAGSMFIARTKAILPLLTIALSETDFEAEAGQLDGTLAHTLERIFPVSAFSVGLRTCSPDNSVTKNYQFTNKLIDTNYQGSNLAKTSK